MSSPLTDSCAKIFVIKRNGADGPSYPLAGRQCVIGRGTECDIRIQLPNVAYQHCRIDVEPDGRIYVANMGRGNVTLLNQVPVTQPLEVFHTDILTIIDRSFRIEIPEAQKLRSPGMPRRVLASSPVTSTGTPKAASKAALRASSTPLAGAAQPAELPTAGAASPPSIPKISKSRRSSGIVQVANFYASEARIMSPAAAHTSEGDIPEHKESRLSVASVNLSMTASALSPAGASGRIPRKSSMGTLLPVKQSPARRSPSASPSPAASAAESVVALPTSNAVVTPAKGGRGRSKSSLSPRLVASPSPGEVPADLIGTPASSESAGGPSRSQRSQRSTASPADEDQKPSGSSSPAGKIRRVHIPSPAVTADTSANIPARLRRSLASIHERSVSQPLPESPVAAAADSSPVQHSGYKRKATDSVRAHTEAETAAVTEKRRRVSFGGHLSPELFDKKLPPATPLRKGATPLFRAGTLDSPVAGLLKRRSLVVPRNSTIVEEVHVTTDVRRSPRSVVPLTAGIVPGTAISPAHRSLGDGDNINVVNVPTISPPPPNGGSAGDVAGPPQSSRRRSQGSPTSKHVVIKSPHVPHHEMTEEEKELERKMKIEEGAALLHHSDVHPSPALGAEAVTVPTLTPSPRSRRSPQVSSLPLPRSPSLGSRMTPSPAKAPGTPGRTRSAKAAGMSPSSPTKTTVTIELGSLNHKVPSPPSDLTKAVALRAIHGKLATPALPQELTRIITAVGSIATPGSTPRRKSLTKPVRADLSAGSLAQDIESPSKTALTPRRASSVRKSATLARRTWADVVKGSRRKSVQGARGVPKPHLAAPKTGNVVRRRRQLGHIVAAPRAAPTSSKLKAIYRGAADSTGHAESPMTIVITGGGQRLVTLAESNVQDSGERLPPTPYSDVPPTPASPGEMIVSPIASGSTGHTPAAKSSARKQSRSSSDENKLDESLLSCSTETTGAVIARRKAHQGTDNALANANMQPLAGGDGRWNVSLASPEVLPEGKTSLVGVGKHLPAPKERRSTSFIGVKELLQVPNQRKSIQLAGVKELLRSPKRRQSTSLVGVKELLGRAAKGRNSSVSYDGIKDLVSTPPQRGRSVPSTTVKELPITKKERRSASLTGIRELFAVPKERRSISLVGVKELMKTPKKAPDVTLVGVKELLRVPKERKSVNLTGVRELMRNASGVQSDRSLSPGSLERIFASPKEDGVSIAEKDSQSAQPTSGVRALGIKRARTDFTADDDGVSMTTNPSKRRRVATGSPAITAHVAASDTPLYHSDTSQEKRSVRSRARAFALPSAVSDIQTDTKSISSSTQSVGSPPFVTEYNGATSSQAVREASDNGGAAPKPEAATRAGKGAAHSSALEAESVADVEGDDAVATNERKQVEDSQLAVDAQPTSGGRAVGSKRARTDPTADEGVCVTANPSKRRRIAAGSPAVLRPVAASDTLLCHTDASQRQRSVRSRARAVVVPDIQTNTRSISSSTQSVPIVTEYSGATRSQAVPEASDDGGTASTPEAATRAGRGAARSRVLKAEPVAKVESDNAVATNERKQTRRNTGGKAAIAAESTSAFTAEPVSAGAVQPPLGTVTRRAQRATPAHGGPSSGAAGHIDNSGCVDLASAAVIERRGGRTNGRTRTAKSKIEEQMRQESENSDKVTAGMTSVLPTRVESSDNDAAGKAHEAALPATDLACSGRGEDASASTAACSIEESKDGTVDTTAKLITSNGDASVKVRATRLGKPAARTKAAAIAPTPHTAQEPAPPIKQAGGRNSRNKATARENALSGGSVEAPESEALSEVKLPTRRRALIGKADVQEVEHPLPKKKKQSVVIVDSSQGESNPKESCYEKGSKTAVTGGRSASARVSRTAKQQHDFAMPQPNSAKERATRGTRRADTKEPAVVVVPAAGSKRRGRSEPVEKTASEPNLVSTAVAAIENSGASETKATSRRKRGPAASGHPVAEIPDLPTATSLDDTQRSSRRQKDGALAASTADIPYTSRGQRRPVAAVSVSAVIAVDDAINVRRARAGKKATSVELQEDPLHSNDHAAPTRPKRAAAGKQVNAKDSDKSLELTGKPATAVTTKPESISTRVTRQRK